MGLSSLIILERMIHNYNVNKTSIFGLFQLNWNISLSSYCNLIQKFKVSKMHALRNMCNKLKVLRLVKNALVPRAKLQKRERQNLGYLIVFQISTNEQLRKGIPKMTLIR